MKQNDLSNQTLELLIQLNKRFDGFAIDMANLRTELKEDIENVRTELNQDITNLRIELKDNIENVRIELKAVYIELKEDIGNVHTELKQDIETVRTEIKAVRNHLRSDFLGMKVDVILLIKEQKRFVRIEKRQAIVSYRLDSLEADIRILQEQLKGIEIST